MTFVEPIMMNCFIPLIPILAWNIVFASKLPSAYKPQSFDKDIPTFTVVGENIFRTIIFILPLFFKIGIENSMQRVGGIIFLVGVVLYFASWLMLIYSPDSRWSKNAIGFSAPAFTPIIWLIGLSFMVDDY